MTGLKDVLDLFKVRDFRLLWIGVLISQVGDWMQITAQGWLVVNLTESPLALTIVTASGILPQLVFVLIGGIIADRFNKRTILRWLVTAQLILSVTLTVLVVQGLSNLVILSLFSLGLGIGAALWQPVYLSYIPELIPQKKMGTAMGISLVALYTARTLGPVLAGIAVALIGVRDTYLLNTLSFVAPCILLFMIHTEGSPGKKKKAVLRQLKRAIQVVRSDDILFPLWTLNFFLSLTILPVFAVLPLFVKDVLEMNATGLSILMAVNGVGQLLGALLTSVYKTQEDRFYGKRQLIGYLSIGVLICTFALSESLLLSAVALGIFNMLHGFLSPRVNTIVQLHCEEETRGRVQSLFLFTFGLVPVGQILLGGLAELLDIQGAVFLVALGFALLSGYYLFISNARLKTIWQWKGELHQGKFQVESLRE